MTESVKLPIDLLLDAARDLALAGRWARSAAVLDAAAAEAPPDAAARLALTAADLAVDAAWHHDTDAAARLAAVDGRALDPAGRWDLDFAWARFEYRAAFGRADTAVQRRTEALAAAAPDGRRRGWAHMYLGLIADNLLGDRVTAPPHYEEALAASADDDLLRREAQRHLGDHDHDAGDHADALARWQEATALGARAGNVPGTLSQQLLLAVLYRDAGDEPAAAALATEVARWAAAMGATNIAARATAFLHGVDPTQPEILTSGDSTS